MSLITVLVWLASWLVLSYFLAPYVVRTKPILYQAFYPLTRNDYMISGLFVGVLQFFIYFMFYRPITNWWIG